MRQRIKEILIEFQKSSLPSLFKRHVPLAPLPKNVRKALVFIGMRRVGKTYLMYQHMEEALSLGRKKDKLCHINFDDDRLSGFSSDDFQTIIDVYFEMFPEHVDADDLIFYFDEIQNVDGWEKFIRRLIDKEKMEIFITGSSAKSLSREIATNLRGRCLAAEVFPLSFEEYLDYRGIRDISNLTSKQEAALKNHSQTYLWQGGFPETLDATESMHQRIIQSYVNAAVFRDVIDRHNLTSPHLVKLFLIQCLQNIASPLSVTKIYHILKSRGETLSRNRLYEYLEYFEDAYLLFSIPIFELSARKRQVNPSKIYCVDTGIINAYSIKPQTEASACLENATYICLRRQEYENIFYYKTRTGKEVDFVAQRPNGSLELVQACAQLQDPDTRKREIQALVEAAKELEIEQATIVTTYEEEVVEFDSLQITVLPYWKWSLTQPSKS